jgi:hypothetical protein
VTIQLSEAIRLGSLLVDHPQAADIERCAIGMALRANGAVPETSDISLAPPKDEELRELDEGDPPVRDSECLTFHSLNVALCSHRALLSAYPWLESARSDCPWCGRVLRSTELLHHGFDEHVIGQKVPLEALCSWIASLEPPPLVPPQPRDIGLGVWFEDEGEKRALLRAAAATGLTPEAYVAAAARLVMAHSLPLQGFERPRPAVLPGQGVKYRYSELGGTTDLVLDGVRPS